MRYPLQFYQLIRPTSKCIYLSEYLCQTWPFFCQPLLWQISSIGIPSCISRSTTGNKYCGFSRAALFDCSLARLVKGHTCWSAWFLMLITHPLIYVFASLVCFGSLAPIEKSNFVRLCWYHISHQFDSVFCLLSVFVYFVCYVTHWYHNIDCCACCMCYYY